MSSQFDDAEEIRHGNHENNDDDDIYGGDVYAQGCFIFGGRQNTNPTIDQNDHRKRKRGVTADNFCEELLKRSPHVSLLAKQMGYSVNCGRKKINNSNHDSTAAKAENRSMVTTHMQFNERKSKTINTSKRMAKSITTKTPSKTGSNVIMDDSVVSGMDDESKQVQSDDRFLDCDDEEEQLARKSPSSVNQDDKGIGEGENVDVDDDNDDFEMKDETPTFPKHTKKNSRQEGATGDDDLNEGDDSIEYGNDNEGSGRSGKNDMRSLDPEKFLDPPEYPPEVIKEARQRVLKAVDGPLNIIEERGYDAYVRYLKEREQTKTKRTREASTQNIEDSVVRGDPREYQRLLFDVAKERNTIINLGTGYGKTLIALLCIQHFSDAYSVEKGIKKQTLFLVPSVALAYQQSTTLRANLPNFTVRTACYANANSESARKKLSKCNIIVATHGAMQDLLMHYADMFQMKKFNLLVVDECHYATGNHTYAVIMNKFYHKTEPSERPHVLGLTASPLVNVKESHTDEQLDAMLQQLEVTLDSTLISLGTLMSTSSDGTNSVVDYQIKSAEERVIRYVETHRRRDIPTAMNSKLHESRYREFNQLSQLYKELGPLVVDLYCQTLINEMSRNEFESETPQEFNKAIEHLERIVNYCRMEHTSCPNIARTDKLMALEELLEDEIEDHGGTETVGLVFVERRVTAMALYTYFRWRDKQLHLDSWKRASQERGEIAFQSLRFKLGEITGAEKELQRSKLTYGAASALAPGLDGNNMCQFDDSPDDPSFLLAAASLQRLSPPASSMNAQQGENETKNNDCDDNDDNESSQFMDADDDDFLLPYMVNNQTNDNTNTKGNGTSDVMSDGLDVERKEGDDNNDDEDDIDDDEKPSSPKIRNRLRPSVLVRNSTQIFKSLCIRRKLITTEESFQERQKEWIHQDMKVREVLTKLCRKEVNLLIATSVVEEGVDVQACSFVVVFDNLKNTKSYVQMKGRARKENAKFFVFQQPETRGKSSLPLDMAQDLEKRVQQFIETKSQTRARKEFLEARPSQYIDIPIGDAELQALADGHYVVEHGTVDLDSAKSLLNRYALSVPLDPFARTSKGSLLAHMPIYKSEQLILPSHLPRSVRTVSLPAEYHCRPKREKNKLMSLAACVRLHMNGLLNDRLLPLNRRDMQRNILKVTKRKFQTNKPVPTIGVDKFFLGNSQSTSNEKEEAQQDQEEAQQDEEDAKQDQEQHSEQNIYIATIEQASTNFSQFERAMKGRGHKLAVVTFEDAGNCNGQVFPMRHSEFGNIDISFGEVRESVLNKEQKSVLSKCFLLLMNERWRKRSRNNFFRLCKKEEYDSVSLPYMVGIVTPDGILDWGFMEQLVVEGSRTRAERIKAVRAEDASTVEAMRAPRLWSPMYDEPISYISYGPSGIKCDAIFPHEKEGVTTYRDYFLKCRNYKISRESALFDVQRLWSLPSNLPLRSQHDDNANKSPEILIKTKEASYEICPELASVRLAQSACVERPLANTHVYLLTTFLPQTLFIFERFMKTKAFVEYCICNMPTLGKCLQGLSIEKVATALTAKSCNPDDNYEKLEWFGDAVLKLVQTDSLLKSIDLRAWICFLHEGDLSTLRSALGSNDRLEEVCRHLRLEKFIMTEPLARGQWMPSCMKMVNDSSQPQGAARSKVFADVIESILGLIYLEFGYSVSLDVSDELNLTVPWDDANPQTRDQSRRREDLLHIIRSCTGYSSFKRPLLAEEAFSHPSANNPHVPSYQRLEWVGDAVLCLAVREWLYKTFLGFSLGRLVVYEAALVSNETLAFLCIKLGLQHYLSHRDLSLPSRIEKYIWSVRDMGCGLWGADPPKAISDIVESILGAIHIDGGFEAGQRAVNRLLRKIFHVLVQAHAEKRSLSLRHPKKMVQELGGELLELQVLGEAEFTKSMGKLALNGSKWEYTSAEGCAYISTIGVLGTLVVATSDASPTVARNHTCALMAQVIIETPGLRERIQSCRAIIESGQSRIFNEKAAQKDPPSSQSGPPPDDAKTST